MQDFQTNFEDTIVAISTPPGRGGIGIVRLSGGRARAIAEAMLRVRHPLAHGMARFGAVVDEAGEVLDEAVVTLFVGPRSYTSEDVVEIAVHGAPVLLESLVRRAIAGGARLAEPGEFTERAFLSGRLDLTQAEAVHDLIEAQTLHQAKVAAAQLGGSIARVMRPIRQELLELIAGLEAGVDFAEDDLDLMAEEEIVRRIEGLIAPLDRLAGSYGYGRIVRDGVKLAIVGRPNAGKSSLFNRLLERERAIVTAQPGTTRDAISERVSIAGIPIELVDTAGLREVTDEAEFEAERVGIERSRMAMAEADVVLHVVDATAVGADDWEMWEGLAGRPAVLVVNKCDLVGEDEIQGFFASLRMTSLVASAVNTSAVTGEGLEELKRAIVGVLAFRPEGDSPVVTNLRQAEALGVAGKALGKALVAAKDGVPHEFVLLDLQEGLEALEGLVGMGARDEVLGMIFSRFCIGK